MNCFGTHDINALACGRCSLERSCRALEVSDGFDQAAEAVRALEGMLEISEAYRLAMNLLVMEGLAVSEPPVLGAKITFSSI